MTAGLDARVVMVRSSGFRLDVEITVEAGSTVALLGPNGAGKTTAVWLLAGILPIDAGRITLAGRVLADPAAGISLPPQERRIGAVFQDVLLFPHLTVAGNVAFALRRRHRSQAEADRAAAGWLERFGIADLVRVAFDRDGEGGL